ncbi:MAG: alpha/beta fold hydrolase, partial [Planctomycetaceae bacterium]|nr:alpha/beta fold hydrolase [Planctomycetaceae bacterium]
MLQRLVVPPSYMTLVGILTIYLSTIATVESRDRNDELARKRYLGIEIRRAIPEKRDKLKSKEQEGVIVDCVDANFLKENAGFVLGDILTDVNETIIASPSHFIETVSSYRPGETVTISFLRNGKKSKTKVLLKSRPLEASDAYQVIYGTVVSRGKRLRTIVTRPKDNEKHPAIFLIQGLGAFSIERVPYRVGLYDRIIDDFARRGYVTIRVDKPGQGDSEGGPTRDIDFETELDGYRQALKFLKSFEFVNADDIIIFGHSMGGIMAPIIGAEIKVRGIAVYGTVGRTWHEYTLENVRRQMSFDVPDFNEIDRTLRQDAAIDLYITAGLSPTEISAQHPELKKEVDEWYTEGMYHGDTNYKYFRQLAGKNFAQAWTEFSGHSLAAWGKSDFISEEVDHALIARIINRVHPGYGVFVTVEGIDHKFNRASSQKESFENFQKPDHEYNPIFLVVLREWASKVCGGGGLN